MWAVGNPTNPAATGALTSCPTAVGRGYANVSSTWTVWMTARIAELPDREKDIIAARTAELRHNMQTTLAGLKAAAEQGS